MSYAGGPHHYRAIWISDFHLGTRGCKAEFLLDFLRQTESEYLYLVGDIVDGWRLKKSWYWVQSHNDVVQKILRKARKGTNVFYIPGNHDEWLRDYADLQMGGVQLLPEAIQVTADGRRLLVIHGDAFDGVVRYARWLALLGGGAWAIPIGRYRPTSKARSRTRSSSSAITPTPSSPRPAAAASTGLSAVTSTRRRSAMSAACSIVMTAIGSKAAPRWSSISTAGSKSCTGCSSKRLTPWRRRHGHAVLCPS